MAKSISLIDILTIPYPSVPKESLEKIVDSIGKDRQILAFLHTAESLDEGKVIHHQYFSRNDISPFPSNFTNYKCTALVAAE